MGTLFSGGFFGLLFGIIDIEKEYKHMAYLLWEMTFTEIMVFAPVGLMHGAIIGFLFMLFRFCENKKR